MTKFITAIMIVLLSAGPANAIRIFDGNRKGFTLQENIGLGFTTVNYDSLGSSRVTRGAFNIEVKIGYGKTDQLQLYFINKLAIIDVSKMGDDFNNYFDKMSGEGLGAIFYILISPFVIPFIPYGSSHSLIGIGGDYYFDKSAPSYFMGAGFGTSIMYNPISGETIGGPGFFISAGYEFQKHLNLKFDILYGFTVKQKHDTSYYDPYYSELPERKTRALSFLFTLGFHQY